MSKSRTPEDPLMKQLDRAEKRSYFAKVGKKQKPAKDEHTVAPGHKDS